MASRIFKALIKLAVGLLALVLVLSAVGHTLISRQDHQLIRRNLAERIERATGYDLAIHGDLEFPYSLRPSVVINDLSLNVSGDRREFDLVKAASMQITIRVLPLLNDEVRIDDTVLRGVSAYLEVDTAGRPNWVTDVPDDSTEGSFAFEVRSIELLGLTAVLRDQRTGLELNAGIHQLRLDAPVEGDHVDVSLTAIYEEHPVSLEGQIGERDNVLEGLEFPLRFAGRLAGHRFAAEGHVDRMGGGNIQDIGFHLQAHVEGGDMREIGAITGIPLPPTDAYTIDGTLDGNPLPIVASELNGTLGYKSLNLLATGRIGRLLSFDELELDAVVTGSDLRETPYFDPGKLPKTDEFEITARVLDDWPALSFEDIEARASFDDINATATGTIADASTLSGVDLSVTSQGRSIDDLAAIFAATAPPSDSYSLAGRLHGTWPGFSASNATLALQRETTKVRATGSIKNLQETSGLQIHIETSGTDLAAIPELRALDAPQTNRFEFNGELSGQPNALTLNEMSLLVTRGEHEVRVSGQIANANEFSGIDWRLQATGTDLRELNDVFTPQFPETHRYSLDSTLTGDIDNLAADKIVLDGSMPGLTVSVEGSIGKIVDVRDVDVTADISISDLHVLGAYLGVDLPDLVQLNLTGNVTGDFPNMSIANATYRSGESLVRGNASLNLGDRPAISGAVSSGAIDLRPFLVTKHDEAEVTLAEQPDHYFSSEPFDFAALDRYDLDFRFDNLELIAEDRNAHVKSASLTLENGSLALDNLELVAGDTTTVTGFLSIDRRDVPVFRVDLDVVNVNLVTFLREIHTYQFYRGTFDMTLDVEGQGESARELAGTIDGEIGIFVSDAVMPSVSLNLRITDVLLSMLPWVENRDDVQIECAISLFAIEDGIVDVRLLYLDSAQIRMLGGGSIDLGIETVDLRLAPRRPSRRVFAHDIDVLVRGSLLSPEFATAGASKAVAKTYGKYALLGPAGLLIPGRRTKNQPCAGSLSEFRDSQPTE